MLISNIDSEHENESIINKEVEKDLKATDESFERNNLDDIIDEVIAKEENDSEDIETTTTETTRKYSKTTKTPVKVSKTPKKKKELKKQESADKSDLDISLNITDNDQEKDDENSKEEYKADKDPKIIRYRKYLRLAGLWMGSMVKNSDLEAMKSRKARYDYMKQIFIDAGFTKSLSIENCKKFKFQLEQKKEIAELDISNIIDMGSRRSRRRTGAVRSGSLKESDEDEVKEEEDCKVADPLANMKDLIGSDSSDEEKKPRRKAKKAMSSCDED